MKRKIKSGYKVLKISKDGTLTSITNDYYHRIEYNKIGKTRRSWINGGLAVFKTIRALMEFMNSLTFRSCVIVKVKYRESKIKKLFCHSPYSFRIKRIIRNDWYGIPSGTDFADWIKIIW